MRPEVLRQRPPRTDGHRQRDAAIRRFADAGLVPRISCNGSDPGGDIQVVMGGKPGECLEAWITQRGEARLAAVPVP